MNKQAIEKLVNECLPYSVGSNANKRVIELIKFLTIKVHHVEIKNPQKEKTMSEQLSWAVPIPDYADVDTQVLVGVKHLLLKTDCHTRLRILAYLMDEFEKETFEGKK